MLAENEWKEIFGEYNTCFLTFNAKEQFIRLNESSAKYVDARHCITEKMNMDEQLRKDLKRPVYVIFLEDFSKCWMFTYDNFCVIEKDSNVEQYGLVEKIEYVRITDVTCGGDCMKITCKSHDNQPVTYRLDGTLAPMQIINKITDYIMKIRSVIGNR